MRRTKTLLSLMLAFTLLTLFAESLWAQTPDGMTPAIEEDCSELSGAAFGLCNAYCEAMDCHLYYEVDAIDEPNASEVACLRVKENFIKITGLGAFPCECVPGQPGQYGCACDAQNPNPCANDLVCDEGVCVEEEDQDIGV